MGVGMEASSIFSLSKTLVDLRYAVLRSLLVGSIWMKFHSHCGPSVWLGGVVGSTDSMLLLTVVMM